MKNKEEKVQWNTRIRTPYKRGADVAASLYGCRTQDQLAELGIRFLLGLEDEETRQRRERVKKAWKTMGDTLPFNSPLTPCISNAA